MPPPSTPRPPGAEHSALADGPRRLRRTTRPATATAAELAARLLGAAHAVRGAFDESSLDAPPTRTAAQAALGDAAFDVAYQSTAGLSYEESLALARAALPSG